MTGAWNTLPARPNPPRPTVSMRGDCSRGAEVRYGGPHPRPPLPSGEGELHPSLGVCESSPHGRLVLAGYPPSFIVRSSPPGPLSLRERGDCIRPSPSDAGSLSWTRKDV